MRQMIKQILWVLFLAFSVQVSWAFSLGGPIGSGNDARWQVSTIGYMLGYNGELAAPKNWGEGYRRNTPIVYYGFDASFSSGQNGFFGTNAGPAAVDSAFAIMNSLTNVSSYSTDLSEFPTDSRQMNYLGYNLGLLDLKTETLGLIVEQMGLVDPVLYSWTLHNRQGPAPGETCPAGMSYEVVERNFDPSSYADGAPIYSPYVNGTLYSYYIAEFCSEPGTPPNAITIPYSVDPFGDQDSPVASSKSQLIYGNLHYGEYYTGLTRDDVAGLRTLLSSNNVPVEDGPAGSLELMSNLLPPQLLTTTNYGGFLASLLTSDPATLETNFPGLVIDSVATNFVSRIFTNISLYYTNQTVLPTFSNFIVGGLTNGYYFTNQPGPTVINFDNTSFNTLTDMDLALFVDQAKTNDPATLQTLYPGLVILNYYVRPVLLLVTNYVSYLTNLTGSAIGTPVPVTVPSSVYATLATNWYYTFGNVITNHFYTNRLVAVQNIFSGPLIGAPFGNPLVIQTNNYTYYTNLVSGDFFLIPTNWCGFDVSLSAQASINPPYQYSYTNTIIYQGYTTNNTSTGTTNLPSASQYGYIRSYYYAFTNYVYAVTPGICEPVLTVGTNYSTNVVAQYAYSFGNIVTNTYSSNTYVTVITTNITPVFGGAPNGYVTNVTVSSYYTNLPTGDFFIIPTNWCNGLNIISNYYTNTIYVTNVFVVTNNPTGSTNVGQFIQTIISQYTNDTYLVQPSICSSVAPVPEQRRGVEHVQFVRANYDSDLGQFFLPITNTFTLITVTNNQNMAETFQRVLTRPDILFLASDQVGSVGDVGLPNFPVTSTLTFDVNNVLPTEGGPGLVQPQQDFTFNKGGPVLDNYRDLNLMDGQAYLNGFNYALVNSLYASYFVWSSFDGSTNPPVIYPQNISLSNLENQSLLRISPLNTPDATNSVPYSVAFTALGGQPPYSLALAPQNNLPNGLSLSGFAITGTPSDVAGIYDFILILSDSGGRTVQYNYSITLH